MTATPGSTPRDPAVGDPVVDVRLDERGRRCPLPVIALARAAGAAAPGTVVELLADDPAAESDVAAWCRMRGHELLVAQPGRYLVRLGPRVPA